MIWCSMFMLIQFAQQNESIVATRKKNSECRLCYCIIAADQYMSLMLCCACPPSLNTVSLNQSWALALYFQVRSSLYRSQKNQWFALGKER